MTFPPSVSQFHFNEEVCQFVRFCFFLALLFRFFLIFFRCFDFLLTFFICSFFFDLCFRCFFLVEPVVFYSLLCFSFFCLVDCTATCECVSSHFPLSPWMVGIDALKDVFKGKEREYEEKRPNRAISVTTARRFCNGPEIIDCIQRLAEYAPCGSM